MSFLPPSLGTAPDETPTGTGSKGESLTTGKAYFFSPPLLDEYFPDVPKDDPPGTLSFYFCEEGRVRLALSQQTEEPRINMRLCAALRFSSITFSRPTTFSSLGNHLTLNSFPR